MNSPAHHGNRAATAHDREVHAVVRSVTTRVAGEVRTEAFAHHIGTSSQQLGVTVADTLIYVDTPKIAAGIARAFGEARLLARRHQLTTDTPRGSLSLAPGARPPGLLLRFDDVPATACGFQVHREISGQVVPAHVWVRTGPVLWQLCDTTALERLAEVWVNCSRIFAGPIRTTDETANDDTTTDDDTTDDDTTDDEAVAASDDLTCDGPVVGGCVGDDVQRPSAELRQRHERGDTNVADDAPGATPWVPLAQDAAHARDDPRSDAELLAAYATCDDQVAFAVLFRRHRWPVQATVRRVVDDLHTAQDAAQLTWIKVAGSAGQFRGEAQVGTWLHRIAHHTALNLVRQRSTRTGAETHYAAIERLRGSNEAVVRVDTMLLLGQLLGKLSPTHREAIILVDLAGVDLPEAAAKLGIPLGTLKSRRSRAHAALVREATQRGASLDLQT